MRRNVLFITVDQWRGDSLSCMGHPVVKTPNLDSLAAGGVLFTNHWANAAPCGPSRACLYTGMYMQNHRSVMNGTPLDARFTNVALEARRAGYDPVLFGYTDTSVDPRAVPVGDPRTMTYEGVLPGFNAVVTDPSDQGSLEWGKWLAEHGIDVPSVPAALYEPDTSYPGADDHASTWAPTKFPAELSETAFMTDKVIEWLRRHGEKPFFMHISYLRPHPPRRNPVGYHDLYSEEEVGSFTGFADPDAEAAFHPLNAAMLSLPLFAAPRDERERRQLRATYYGAQQEVDDQLGRLFGFLRREGFSQNTLVVLTSDHGEMGGDHWLVEKCGYWDESFQVPLIVRDPTAEADLTRGLAVREPTESVDVSATILDWLGLDIPRQFDGWPLTPFLRRGEAPEHWRTAVHWEWDMRHARLRLAEGYFGIPSDHCSLAVVRGPHAKYVQFAADADVLPPLLFDLVTDPGHVRNLATNPAEGYLRLAGAWDRADMEAARWGGAGTEAAQNTEAEGATYAGNRHGRDGGWGVRTDIGTARDIGRAGGGAGAGAVGGPGGAGVAGSGGAGGAWTGGGRGAGPGGAGPGGASGGTDGTHRGGGADVGAAGTLELELVMAQEMLRWRMRNLERTLSNCYLAPGTGPVWSPKEWR